MAKTQKYSEEKLLEAVVTYAKEYKGVIKATQLAEWAAKNIDGLEGVADYHFLRPVKKKDPQSGIVKECAKLCTAKINELNAARRISVAVGTNPLLMSTTVDRFLQFPLREQRKMILETRKQVDSLIAENAYLRGENQAVKAESQAISMKVGEINQKHEKLKTDQARLLTLTSRAMERIDEAERRKMLESIGVCDGGFDLDTYVESLTVQISDVFNINSAIRKYRTANNSVSAKELMEGIEFE